VRESSFDRCAIGLDFLRRAAMANFADTGRWSRLWGAGTPHNALRTVVVAAALLAGMSTPQAAVLSFDEALSLAEQRSAALASRRAAAEGAEQARTA
jgi:hypothetical protein